MFAIMATTSYFIITVILWIMYNYYYHSEDEKNWNFKSSSAFPRAHSWTLKSRWECQFLL
jgi:hypothetical protein